MAKERRGSFSTPGELVLAGAAIDPVAGWIVAGVMGFVAQAVFAVGIIAKGVQVGNRSSG